LSNLKTADCLATEEISFKAWAPVTAFFSKGARTSKTHLTSVFKLDELFRERLNRSSDTENFFHNFGNIFSSKKERHEKTQILHVGRFFIAEKALKLLTIGGHFFTDMY
jgi:hypothetical protein